MSIPDGQLLLRMHNGDHAAAEMLWERFSPRLLAYSRSLVGAACGPSGAEDAVQSVMLRVISVNRAQLETVQDVAAWLLTLTRNQVISTLRTIRRERSRQFAAARREASEPLPAVSSRRIAHVDSVRTAIDALPRRTREVIVLRHVAGLTFDQIALTLAQNRNTVAARYRAGKAQIERLLEQDQAANRQRGGPAKPHGTSSGRTGPGARAFGSRAIVPGGLHE